MVIVCLLIFILKVSLNKMVSITHRELNSLIPDHSRRFVGPLQTVLKRYQHKTKRVASRQRAKEAFNMNAFFSSDKKSIHLLFSKY